MKTPMEAPMKAPIKTLERYVAGHDPSCYTDVSLRIAKESEVAFVPRHLKYQRPLLASPSLLMTVNVWSLWQSE